MTDESKAPEPLESTPAEGTPIPPEGAAAPQGAAAASEAAVQTPPAAHQGSLLLGRIAVERGYITREQLQACIQDQTRDADSGRPARSLGIILVEKGYLSDTKLVSILDEQKSRFQQPGVASPVRQDDAIFGRLIAQHNIASPQQINECLRLQAEAQERGETPPRLGELLVQKGYAAKEAVAKLLALQQKTILSCPRCNMKYNVTGYQPGREFRCKKCNGTLVPPQALDSVHVDESVHDHPPVVDGDAPPEVIQAARNPRSHFGKYILLKELGRGGMGVVYKAWQTDLCRMVALKMLSSRSPSVASPYQASLPEDEVKRFYREAQTAANLRHAHIVAIYEVGQIQQQYYLAMEFVDGMTLDRWIRAGKLREAYGEGRRTNRGAQPFRRAAEIVRDVALAVQSAHEQGIIHRDMKPQNILMDHRGRPHVTDFGLAKSIRAEKRDDVTATVSGLILGTPAYMSPEQASGGKKKMDARTDIYSMGAVLYECLAGRPPFSKGSSIDIVMQVLRSEPLPPSQVARQTVPKDLEIICQRAMEKDAFRRYQTAKLLAKDLDRWLQGEPILARPQSTMYRLQRKVRNNPVVAAALAAAALALLAGGYFALSGPSEQEVRRQQFASALRDGEAQLEKKQYAEALVLLRQAQKIDPNHLDVKRAIDKCTAALDREKRLLEIKKEEERARLEAERKRAKEMEEKLAKLQQEMEDIRKRREQAKTEEEKRALEAEARKKEEEARRIAAGKPPDATGVTKPPDATGVTKPPDATGVTKPPDVPVPAPGAVAPPVPLTGKGPQLLAAHRYGEMHDALRRDRKAYGPITDHQVACIAAGKQLWETLHLNKQAFQDRKPRLDLPILKALPGLTDAVIVDFNVSKGDIDLRVRMDGGGSGTVTQKISELGVRHLIGLAEAVSRDEDAKALVQYANLYALHGETDDALNCLGRAKQLGAETDAVVASVVAGLCVPPKDDGKILAWKAKVEGLLKDHGTTLDEASRTRIETALTGVRDRLAAGEAMVLLQQAKAAAQNRQIREAHALGQQILAKYPGTRAAADAKALLQTLPHPDGRLLNGFDTDADMKEVAKSPNAAFERVVAPGLVKEGAGALRLRLTTAPRPPIPRPAAGAREGSIAGFKLKAEDFGSVRAVNFWVRGLGDHKGTVLFCCYSAFPGDYYYARFRVDRTWSKVRLPLTGFTAEGTPNWGAVMLISCSWFDPGTIDFVIDSVRVEE